MRWPRRRGREVAWPRRRSSAATGWSRSTQRSPRAEAGARPRPAGFTSAAAGSSVWSATSEQEEAVVAAGSILALALIAEASQGVTPLEAAEPPACDVPGQAPDPRCNENLDGREAPDSSASRQAARAALAPPRAAARLVLLPVVE